MKKTILGFLMACAVGVGAYAQTGKDLVDMGVSVLWSSVNIGAATPSATGDYYCWGTTSPATSYPYQNPLSTKTSVKNIANTEYDTAMAVIGEGWSVPTWDQWKELIAACTFETTTLDGVSGVLATSKTTGNSIFLPGAGYKGTGGVVKESGTPYYPADERFSTSSQIRTFTMSNGSATVVYNKITVTYPTPVRPVALKSMAAPAFDALHTSMTATASIEAGSEQPGTIAITQTGGQYDFNKVRFTIEGTYGLQFGDIKVNAARGEDITISKDVRSTRIEVTLTAPDGETFANKGADGEYISDLVTIDFTCPKYFASATNTLKISDIKFYYSATEYMTPAMEDMPMTATVQIVNNATFTIETDQQVDLGLSVLWSGYCVGATSPEQAVSFIRWGDKSEPTMRNQYSKDAYTKPEVADWTGNAKYDAATAQWGINWHTPTEAEAAELFDNCETVPYTYNGVAGIAITSKINGKTIFMPIAGMRTSPNEIMTNVSEGEEARAMLSTASTSETQCRVMCMANGLPTGYITNTDLWNGMLVRPVAKRHVPLHVSLTASESIETGGEAGTLTISQTGGDYPFDKVVFTLSGIDGLSIDAVEAAEGIDVSVAKSSASATVTLTSAEAITAEQLVSIKFSAGKYLPSSSKTLTINGMKFYYSATDYMEPESEDMPLSATVAIVNNATYTIETEQEVDLGLSVLWSGYYLGATTAEGLGDYIQWGSNAKPEAEHAYCAESYTEPPFAEWSGMALFDAAAEQWGGNWRTPTLEEGKELVDNTEIMPYTYNGVAGFAVTSKINGKSIFMAIGGTLTSSAGAITSTSDGGQVRTMLATDGENGQYGTLGMEPGVGTAWIYQNQKYQGVMVRPVADKIILASGLTISEESLTITEGETATLLATIEPAETTDKTIVWSSSNEAVATVDATGVVTAIAAGNAIISATCGEVSASCAVVVTPRVILASGLTLSETALELEVEQTATLVATIEPEDATDKSIAWSSSDEAVATVDTNGTITAIATGTATITATCGEVSATCHVTVNAPVEDGVEELSTINHHLSTIYDLQGRKLTKPVHGINLINGRKVKK